MVRMCGHVFACRWIGGRLVVRKIARGVGLAQPHEPQGAGMRYVVVLESRDTGRPSLPARIQRRGYDTGAADHRLLPDRYVGSLLGMHSELQTDSRVGSNTPDPPLRSGLCDRLLEGGRPAVRVCRTTWTNLRGREHHPPHSKL